MRVVAILFVLIFLAGCGGQKPPAAETDSGNVGANSIL